MSPNSFGGPSGGCLAHCWFAERCLWLIEVAPKHCWKRARPPGGGHFPAGCDQRFPGHQAGGATAPKSMKIRTRDFLSPPKPFFWG